MRFDCSLYLVTDSTGLEENEFLNKIEEACKSGITLLQLREKDKTGREYLELAFKVKEITDKYNIPLIIDDRIDIAMAVDAAGVHVGQSDINVRYARKILGSNKIIGATTKTLKQAEEAVREGADYLGVGAIYPTTTKVKTVITEVSTLKEICELVDIPVVAIGGLNEENSDILKGSKISGIAVVSAIMKAKDIKESVVGLREKISTIKL
ncbi:thiamine phosphate synthase [Clostridium sartagoforme]|uniref:Thiamine-phosphate synthase n=1 Tax=Clostridium sartagoforme TaxID=84031 RepID=A0A4S2DI49_9CLOT|nr:MULTISPECIES: thiamine phosphate synthase [Clostridium]MBS5938596.1 thiamine phosphate synthase [Clostridium sp.]TGY41828.1 thiamine phosphate synthase [Clostridium sartagoforme]